MTPFLVLPMTRLPTLSLLVVCASLVAGTEATKHSIFRSTLPHSLQYNLAHCNNLPDQPKTALCELIAALNAEGEGPPSNQTSSTHSPVSSCAYRTDEGHRMHRYASPPSPHMHKVFQAYMSMHQRCVAIEFHSLAEIYNSGEAPRCRYLVWRNSYAGLGNRLLTLVSAFFYAILTQRVFVIDYPPWNRLFCDPLDGIPLQIPATVPLNHSMLHVVPYLSYVHAACGENKEPKNARTCNKTTSVTIEFTHTVNSRYLEFAACASGTKRLRNVPFIVVQNSNQYFLPLLSVNPAYEALMDILFPERNPFHVISRLLMLPSDEVWTRVRRYAGGKSSRRIGVQIREFRNAYTEAYVPNVVDCIHHRAGFVPKSFRSRCLVNSSTASDEFSVYVATMEKRHVRRLNESLAAVRNETGKSFRYTWQEVGRVERHDVEHQQEALVDMWVLSLSDVLIASRSSTFGYVAQALGNVVSYYINPKADDVCETGGGSDPCYQFPKPKLTCAVPQAGTTVTLGEMLNTSQIVRTCVDTRGKGMQVA